MTNASEPWIYSAPTTIHDYSAGWSDQVEGLLPLSIADGLLWGDAKRYRVVDRWFSFDRHGVFDAGLHLFIEPVAEEDDRLAHEEPEYFSD